MKWIRRSLMIVLTAGVLAGFSTATRAELEEQSLDRREASASSSVASSQLSVEATQESGHSEATNPAGEHPSSGGALLHEGASHGGEHHPAWMFPGWQSFFTFIGFALYAITTTLLPKIMAKEEDKA